MKKKIKIGVFLEGSPKMGGGFFQSLKSLLMLLKIDEYKDNIEVILTDITVKHYFSKNKTKTVLFKNNKFLRYFSELFEVSLFKELLDKFKFKHPFTKFILKNKYDLIIFLGPSSMSKYCSNISFIFNIWDLDHKKNSQFPEHNLNYVYEKKEKLLKEVIFKAFKIVVPHESNKEDLINFYKIKKEQIINQNFIPVLPDLFIENDKKENDYKEIFYKLNLPINKKIVFYPAQFWAHKNHKYIIDAAEIMKNKSIDDFIFVFCGTDKGNLNYLKDLIRKKDLNEYFKILDFISDDVLISMYLNCDSVIMPTYCGPTNLPIYESFYFKKIIFYTKGLIPNDDINNHLVLIDINSPQDLTEKLSILFNKKQINNIVEENYEYYKVICNEALFIKNYKKMLEEFSYLFNRWG